MANRFVSFFEKIGSALKKLFTNPTLEQQVLGFINLAAPAVETVVGLIDPAAAPIVVAIGNEVKSLLATAYTTVSAAQVTAGSPVAVQVAGWLNAIKTNLSSILTDADIKNTAKFSEISATTTGLINEVDAVLAELVPAAPATPAA